MSSKDLTVTVVIPSYNREDLIADTLESVFMQTLMPTEVIVVDDCSSDTTVDRVRGLAKSHPNLNVRCVVQDRNQGVSAARNRGIKEASGEWIALLDSDDLWDPVHLERLAEKQQSTDADIVFSCAKGFAEDDPSVAERTWGSRFESVEEVIGYLIRGCHILPSAMMARRDVLVSAGGFDEEPSIQHAEDLDLLMRLAEKGFRFERVRELTCLYRQHAQSACQNKANLYQAGLYCLNKHRGTVLNTRTEWNEAFAYYSGKLAAALWPENSKGARSAALQAAMVSWVQLRYIGAWLLMAGVGSLPGGRRFVGRYCNRYL